MTTSLSIAFFYYGLPLQPLQHLSAPLGGTESALLTMAHALAARGHRVSIYGNAIAENDVGGVRYRPGARFEADCTPATIDCCISIRHLAPLLAGSFGKVHILWTPDAHDQPFLNQTTTVNFEDQQGARYAVGLYPLSFVAPRIDRIFCVGRWQAAMLQEKFRVSADRCWVAYNGIDAALFARAAQPLAERRRQLVYASTPFRGLDHLVRLFPRIRAAVPDVRGVICSGMQLYGQSGADDQAAYGAIYRQAAAAGLELTGPLAKPALAEIFGASRVLAYPNTFAETFCIAVAEAQAAGVPAVTSHLGALPERIASGESGWLIPGRPDDPAYEEQFVAHVVQLLTDDAAWRAMSDSAHMAATPYDAPTLAAGWEAEIRRMVSHGSAPKPEFAIAPQQFDVLVEGYPKRVDLPATLIRRHIAQLFAAYGFAKAAARIVG